MWTGTHTYAYTYVIHEGLNTVHVGVHTYAYKQELKIGLHVSKKFGHVIFHGIIVGTDVDPKGKNLWHIKYEDDD